jgi:hypothetical protein
MALEYTYAPTLRAIHSNSGPSGVIRVDRNDGRGPFGVIVYDRPLTKKEIEGWALSTVEMPRVAYYVYGVHSNGNQEFLFEWVKNMSGAYAAVEEHVAKKSQTMSFVDYVVKPKPF